MDGENGIEKKFIKKGKVVDIENRTIHSPQRGKTSGLACFLQELLLQFPERI
jgi:hypothetical protein